MAKIILAGGGGAEESRPLDELLAAWIGPGGRLLYLPIALRGIRTFDSCRDWITSTFAPLNIANITLWTELGEHEADDLQAFDAIYIGGGNTYSLMAELIASGFDRHLKDYARARGILYGGSAGAVVLGRDIRTIRRVDPNHVRLAEVNCLDLAAGYSISPHYAPGQDDFIEDFVRTHRLPVLAISERSGVVVEAGQLRSIGFEPSYRFDSRGKSEV